ncbi:MAG: aminotransferase class IV [Cytophagales bacterium]
MKAVFSILNGEKTQENVVNSNRGLDFADGLFETIIINKGEIRFLKGHFQRLMKGFQLLGFEPKTFFTDFRDFEYYFLKITTDFLNRQETLRLKLKVWRKGEGAYQSLESDFEWMIQAFAFEKPKTYIKEYLGFSSFKPQDVAFEGCKTLSALGYVLASNEAKRNNWDDAVLRDCSGNISELSSSNLFWVKNGKVFTPSLKTGCVEGVMRGQVIKLLETLSIEVLEVFEQKDKFLGAESVFACNVLGVFEIKSIENQKFSAHELVKKLQESLCIT